MRQGTTPLHEFELPEEYSKVSIARLSVTYSQGDTPIVVKHLQDCIIEGNILRVKLSQEDTLSFNTRWAVDIQVRIVTDDEEAFVSDVIHTSCTTCLSKEVL